MGYCVEPLECDDCGGALKEHEDYDEICRCSKCGKLFKLDEV